MCRWWWQKNRYASLKICVNNYPAEFMENEMTLSQRICTANPSHPGRQFLRPATDTFRIQGPDGVHPVLVYEAMREPIEMLQMRIGGSFAPDLLKTTLGFILTGLDYLHSECNIVHTGKSHHTHPKHTQLTNSNRPQTRQHPHSIRI